MQSENRQRKQFWIFVALLLVVSALTYLPLVNQIGYLNDDWYLMYDAHTKVTGQRVLMYWELPIPCSAIIRCIIT
jgi:hypothetical protein